MPVDSPRRENAFGEAVFAGTSDVIHDLVPTIFDDGVANARGDRVECFVPGGAFPFSFATFSGAFEWIKNAIGIGYLVECRWTFGAVAPARAGMFRIAFKLLNFARDFVDIREQSTRRFAVEASGGNERVMPLLSLRPRPRIELGPIIPPLLRRKRREMTPTRTRIEGFVYRVYLAISCIILWFYAKRHGLAGLDVSVFEEHQADQCQRRAGDSERELLKFRVLRAKATARRATTE